MADQPGQLRLAGPEDLPELLRLTRAFYDEDGFATSTEDIAANFGALFDSDRAHICLATRGGAAVGFALTTVQLILESGLVAELQDLYVEPEHRGAGIGATLIDDAASWARGLGAALLEVVVAPNGRDVTPLLGFYAARGFRDSGRRLISLDL